ncbi:MAG: PAS domain-containing sensor histidine kinase [Rhodospirillales bacterium]
MADVETICTAMMAVPRAAFVAVADAASGRLRLRTANDAFVSLTGWPCAQVAGADFPPPRLSADLGERVAASVRRERAGRFDLEFAAGAGTGGRLVELDQMPLGGGAWLGFLENVTAERRAGELLASSEARYRNAAESGSDWVWETDAEHRLSWVSPHYVAASPLPIDRILGKRRWEFGADGPDSPLWRRHRDDLDHRRPFRDLLFRVTGLDGAAHHVRISGRPVFDADGKFAGYRGLGRDVTEETEARLHAELAEARLDAAIESMNDGFALFDAGDRLVRVNKKLLEMAQENAELFKPGASYERILRDVAARGVYSGSPVEVEQFLAARLKAHRNPPNDTEYRTAGGMWLRVSETPTADGGVAMVYRNVTQLKRAEETLRNAAEEAETANQAKSEFLANMSHELRTPLNAIIGFAEIIGNQMLGPIGNARYSGYAQDILASGAHLLEVINQVLDMSKIEAGRFDLREEEMDVGDVLGGAARMMENMAAESGLTLILRVPDPSPGLLADRRALRQIALNLLGNAIKFTPRGGRVELEARREANGDLSVAVSDTGVGIAEWDIETALAPLGQIVHPMTRNRAGTGLGLPIVKALVELHGGSLTLTSAVGAGTTATARFPARRVLVERPEEAASA